MVVLMPAGDKTKAWVYQDVHNAIGDGVEAMQ